MFRDKFSAQKVGFVLVSLAVITFVIAVFRNLGGSSGGDARRRGGRDDADSARDSLPPGVRPRPTLNLRQFKEIGNSFTS